MPLNLKSLLFIEALLVVGILLFRAALRPENRAIIGPKAISLTLLTPAVALLCGNVFVFYLYLVGAVAITSRTRAELCATYVMLLPMTPALGQETAAGAVYLVPLSTILAMNFGALVGFVFTSPKRIASSRMLDVGAVLLVTLFVYIDSRNVSASSVIRTSIIFFIQLGVPYLVMSRGIANRDEVFRLFLRFSYVGTLCAIVAIFDTSRHWILYQSFNDALNVPQPLSSATLYVRGGYLRTGGMMVNFAAAGILLANVLVAMPALWSKFRRGWASLICILLLGGIFASQSRGAWIAAGIGILAVIIYRGHIMRGVGLLVAVVAAQTTLSGILAPSSRLAETLGLSGASAQTGEYRKELLSSGLRQISAYPLFGQPPKQLASNMSEMTQGQHIVDFVNTHLYVALAAGVPWFVIWLIIWIAPIVLTWRKRLVGPARGAMGLAEMPMAIIVATMVALTFTSTVDRNLYWPAIALGLIGPCVALRRGERGMTTRSRPVRIIEVSG